jgi:hypothetical protein
MPTWAVANPARMASMLVVTIILGTAPWSAGNPPSSSAWP